MHCLPLSVPWDEAAVDGEFNGLRFVGTDGVAQHRVRRQPLSRQMEGVDENAGARVLDDHVLFGFRFSNVHGIGRVHLQHGLADDEGDVHGQGIEVRGLDRYLPRGFRFRRLPRSRPVVPRKAR